MDGGNNSAHILQQPRDLNSRLTSTTLLQRTSSAFYVIKNDLIISKTRKNKASNLLQTKKNLNLDTRNIWEVEKVNFIMHPVT